MSLKEIEKAQELDLTRKGKTTGPRITSDHVDACIVGRHVQLLPGNITVAILTLYNGWTITGVNHGPVSAENFDAEYGMNDAVAKARDQIWHLEGYLLADRLHRANGGAAVPHYGPGIGPFPPTAEAEERAWENGVQRVLGMLDPDKAQQIAAVLGQQIRVPAPVEAPETDHAADAARYIGDTTNGNSLMGIADVGVAAETPQLAVPGEQYVEGQTLPPLYSIDSDGTVRRVYNDAEAAAQAAAPLGDNAAQASDAYAEAKQTTQGLSDPHPDA